MTSDRDLDLRLAAWFDAQATSVPPTDLLARSLRRVETTHQRPALLVRRTDAGRWVGAFRTSPFSTPLGAAAILLLVALLIVALVVAGSQLVQPRLSVVVPPAATGTASLPQPTSAEPVATVGIRGGGPILAQAYAGLADNGPFDVVAIDAGAGSTTLLGTLDGSAIAGSRLLPQSLMRNVDLTRVIAPLQDATAAAGPFGFTPAPELGPQVDLMAFSPGGDRLAAIRTDKFDAPLEIMIVDLGGTVVAHLPIPTAMEWGGPLTWAPDGSAVLLTGCRPCNQAQTPTETQTAHHAHLYVVPIDGSSWTELLDLDNGQLTGQFSPDGTRLAVERYVCAKGSVMPRCDPMEATSSLSVLTLATGAETPLGVTPGITGIDWSPDGTRIAYGSLGGAFAVDAATGAKVTLADRQSFGADWSPDGQWLLVNRSVQSGPETFDVWIVRADGQQLQRILSGYTAATW
jgi:hypothetical protein